MSNKPTRGPWTVEATDTAGESIYVTNAKPLDDPACVTVARVATMPDARLIAAAPDLAAALRACAKAIAEELHAAAGDRHPMIRAHARALRRANAALAKLDR